MITQEIVKSLFYYKDGFLYWITPKKKGPSKPNGLACSLDHGKYYTVTIETKKYQAHRLIFLWHHGYLPKMVDHKDRNGLNNFIDNLRDADASKNARNRGMTTSKCFSKYKGVDKTYCTGTSKIFRARITVNGKNIALGLHHTEIEAAQAYNVAAIQYHGEFACLNEI